MKDTWWIKPEQLNTEQRAIVPLPLGEDQLVTGPPGSGKTNLLLLRAKHLTLAGQRNLAIVVFTKTLQEFIAAGAQQYAIDPSRVVTSRFWQIELLRDAGVNLDLPEKFEDQRLLISQEIKRLLDENRIDKRYQVILLDEGQDYISEEIDIFRRLSDNLFVVADSRQQIYKGTNSVAYLSSLVGDGHHHTLTYHYRNGHKICTVADAIGSNSPGYSPLITHCQYDEKALPSSVNHVLCASLDEQAQRIVQRLELQLRTYPDELLGVCAPRGSDLNQIWGHIAASSLAPYAVLHHERHHEPFGGRCRVCVTTAHSMKGLEVRALHIAGAEHFRKFPHQHRLAYTTLTRAKTALTLYSNSALPPFLEQAVKSLEPLPNIPALSDLF